VVTATHRGLEKMVEAGTFRMDLLFRLNVMTIEAPPLRERERIARFTPWVPPGGWLSRVPPTG
jgi:transcriptional regulator with GAF, ATPase, and Fis domain